MIQGSYTCMNQPGLSRVERDVLSSLLLNFRVLLFNLMHITLVECKLNCFLSTSTIPNSKSRQVIHDNIKTQNYYLQVWNPIKLYATIRCLIMATTTSYTWTNSYKCLPCHGIRLSENAVRKKRGGPNEGHPRKQHFIFKTARDQRSRSKNWTTRIQNALNILFQVPQISIC